MTPMERKITKARTKRKKSGGKIVKANEKTQEKCNGILHSGCNCDKLQIEDSKYCDEHEYFQKLDENEIQKIINGDAYICDHCCKFYFDFDKGCLYINSDAHNTTFKNDNCLWFNPDNETCKNTPLENSHFCNSHKYVIMYTIKMRNNSEHCSGCNSYRYIKDGCENCKKFSKTRNENVKEKNKLKPHCAKQKCPNLAHKNGFCGKHKKCAIGDTIKNDPTKKMCKNYPTRCTNIINSDSQFDSCEDCRIKERKSDKDRRDKKNEVSKQIVVTYVKNTMDTNNNNSDGINNNYPNETNSDNQNETNNDSNETSNETNMDQNESNNNSNKTGNKIITPECIRKILDETKNKKYSPDELMKLFDKFSENKPEEIIKHGTITIIKNNNTTQQNDKSSIIKNDQNKLAEIQNNPVAAKFILEKICPHCKSQKPLSDFIGNNKQTCLWCDSCRAIERERDSKRDRTGRDYKTYEKNPERKAKKKEWREKNVEKTVRYNVESRARKIERMGVEAFLKQQAGYTSQWRNNNKDKQKEINEKKKTNIKSKIKICRNRAFIGNIKCELTDDEMTQYFLDKCYYCGHESVEDNDLNGIDRTDNDYGYSITNCVTACEMCNTMKGDDLNDEEFIKVCCHILTYLKLIDGELYREYFSDYLTSSYNEYTKRAIENEWSFELSENNFFEIIKNSCYLCGKENTNIHNNGIDRINNSLHYTLNNCLACCAVCNYIKNNYELSQLLKKMSEICKHHQIISNDININDIQKKCLDIFDSCKNINIKTTSLDIEHEKSELNRKKSYRATQIKKQKEEMGEEKYREMKRVEKAKQRGRINPDGSVPPKRIKKTKEEIKEINKLRKQKQREALKQNYTDKDLIDNRIKNILEQKKEKE